MALRLSMGTNSFRERLLQTDRSAAYLDRWIAKLLVHAKLARNTLHTEKGVVVAVCGLWPVAEPSQKIGKSERGLIGR